MERMGRLLAALRVVLVAIGVCLLGPAASLVQTEFDGNSAHAQSTEVPDPGPVAELRDDEPRGGSVDDGVDHGAQPGLTLPAALSRRTRPIRGPPARPRGVPWRPRSSRGPPVQA